MQNNNLANYGKSETLRSDPGYLKQYQSQNFKSMKYYTQNFNDPTVNLNKQVAFMDDYINANSFLTRSQVVSMREKTVLPPLPALTNPSLIRSQGNTRIEDRIRPNVVRDRKTCNPKDYEYYKRTMQPFDGMPRVYNTKQNPGVQARHDLRGGVDTRSMKFDYLNSNSN